MKKLIAIAFIVLGIEASAQCIPLGSCNGNVGINSNNNSKTIAYDNFIGGYHGAIYRDSNGEYMIWGEELSKEGLNQLIPVSMNTYVPASDGSPVLLASMGGATQAVFLTQKGFYAVGKTRQILSFNIVGQNKVTEIKVSNSNEYGLPEDVKPEEIKVIDASSGHLSSGASYGSIYILTCNGVAYELSTINDKWEKIVSEDGVTLPNIVALRAHGGINLLMLGEDNTLWTKGKEAYLGDYNEKKDIKIATQMTSPVGVDIKMIQVGYSDYYVLGKDNKIYTLGRNRYGELSGDGTKIEQKSWQIMQYEGKDMENVAWISANSHSEGTSFGFITKTGKLYTIGENAYYLLGHYINPSKLTDRPKIKLNGEENTVDGIKINFISVNGHTSAIIADGIKTYGYAGHAVNGSMGNGTAEDTSNGQFNFDDTPEVDVCGTRELVCTYLPAMGTPNEYTKVAISTLMNHDFKIWPNKVPNGALLLESKTKGLQLPRGKVEDIKNPIEGMTMYDTQDSCIKLYSKDMEGKFQWTCIKVQCVEVEIPSTRKK